ncbi:MAG TPA: carboxypeptidase regulatory-like domain-containing protein [Bryobacteraceae bacterium]
MLLRVVFLTIIAGGSAVAQVATGNISGYVKDSSGAIVPNATVTAKMVQQDAVRTTKTDAAGFYSLLSLPPGQYEMSFELTGFQKQIQTGLQLTVGQNLRVDGTLQVGSVQNEVTVGAQAPLVDTTAATLSGLIDDQRVQDLPMNGRNVITLARILPGVLNVNAQQAMSDARGGPEMDVNGGRPNMNLFTLNGGYFNNPSRNTGINFPPPDAIQEIRIQTANFSAEYGRNPGSQINVVSKAGTNEFHGAAWEFLRNNDLNARNFFSPSVPALHQNQFGVAAGGPIKKNRLFAFGTYEGLRDRREAQTVESFLPTAAERSGDFRASGSTLTDPVDPLTNQPLTTPSGAPCVVGNVIAPGCISPVAQTLLPFLPQQSGSYVALASQPRSSDLYMIRGDWNQSEKHRVFGSFYWANYSQDSPLLSSDGTIPGYMSTSITTNTREVVLNDIYTFTPSLLNQFTFSFLDSGSNQLQGKNVPPSTFGINMPQYVPNGSVDFNVAGDFILGSGGPTQFFSHNYQYKDTLDWMKGRHNFKFGFELLHLQFEQIFIGSPNASFNGTRSGDPFADFMLGAFASVSGGFGVRDTNSITNAMSWFFQDQFKASNRLTVTLGVRYEPFLPWTEKHDRINTVVPGQQSTVVPDAPPGVVFPHDKGVTRGLAGADLNNFAPRIGLAWDVFGNGRTSVRSAYGVFFEGVNADSLAQENPPFAGFFAAYNGNIADPFGSTGQIAPPVTTTGQFGCVKINTYPGYNCPLFPLPVGGVFTDLSLRTPYIQAFNFSIQHQLTPSLMLETAYAGKIGIKIEALRTYNPAKFGPDPVTGAPASLQNVNDRVLFEPGILGPQGFLLGNDFRSWYHSWQTQITKRFSNGLSIQGSYTLAKSIDSSSTDNLGAQVSNPFDLHSERGRSDWDRRHAFVASWLWTLPFRFSNHITNTLFGGWTLTAIHTIQSGTPLTFNIGQDIALDGTGNGGGQHAFLEPGITAGKISTSHPDRNAMVTQFFNTAAFVPVNLLPAGYYGNAGRGLISGPAFNSTDFSVLKDFKLRESLSLQFRTEMFNVFNQVNFHNPDTTQTDSSFGQILEAEDGRVIQFALKLLW